MKTPDQWAANDRSASLHTPLQWLTQLSLRHQHLDKILQLQSKRQAAAVFWLGAFIRPQALLSLLYQEALKTVSGSSERLILHAEVTLREKDHVS